MTAGIQPTLATGGHSGAPEHVAIIMDGNGRWAKKHGLPRSAGHQRGAEAVREAIAGALEEGVRYLTLYAFSSENWNRSADEVSDLMGLLKLYLKREISSLAKEGVRLRVIGRRSRLSDDINEMIDRAEHLTASNARLTLVIALSYGSRDEIVDAARALAAQVADGQLSVADITEESFEQALSTSGLPDPDLVIRTSGEQRLSNFLLWQAAYAELLFLDLLWPDFTKQTLKEAIAEYQGRERRFGARP